MNQRNFPSCCGAYFLTDVTLKDLENAPKSLKEFPSKVINEWGDRAYDYKAAPVAYCYLSYPSIAYWFIVLNEEENTKEMQEALAKHEFKLKSSTNKRFLYVRSHPEK